MIMQLEFTYANGMVRIKDVTAPNVPAALDFSAPAGAFYSVLSDGGNPLTDTMTIWHEHGNLAVVSFKASECLVPAGANFTILKPLIDAILSQGSPTPSTMTPINTVYVSGTYGSPSGYGAIDSPLDTIAAAVVLAETNSTADNVEWGVCVLAGIYDEQIKGSAGAPKISFTLTSGVVIQYSGLGATVTDADGIVYVNMEQGSVMVNIGGGAVVDCSTNAVFIAGLGTIEHESLYTAVEVTGGDCSILNITLINDPASAIAVADVSAGSLRMVDCFVLQGNAVAPINKSGGDLKLYRCSIFAPSSTESISSPTPQDVQVVGCVSNVAVGVDITETVGAFLVDPAFTL